jgi:Flp pilus assembly protein TadG
MMMKIWRKLKLFNRLGSDRSGAISIEFAFLSIFLVGVTFSTVEFGRYLLAGQKADRVVSTVGDMVTQTTSLTSTDVKDMFIAADNILNYYSYKTKGVIIVSHVHAATANAPTVTWQTISSASFNPGSKIGAVGATATLPASFPMAQGETVVVIESFINFEPWLFDLVFSNTNIYRISYHRPRKVQQIAFTDNGSSTIDTCNPGEAACSK